MTVLVCGSREWTDRAAILREIEKLAITDIVIHGAARGADRIAGEIATSYGLQVRAFPAQWDRYGKSAGPFRNQQMLDQQPDLVLAFTPDLEKSIGTRHMVRIARAAGVPVEIFNS